MKNLPGWLTCGVLIDLFIERSRVFYSAAVIILNSVRPNHVTVVMCSDARVSSAAIFPFSEPMVSELGEIKDRSMSYPDLVTQHESLCSLT